jgi:DNA-binding CsgD family transcriptional regulator
LLLVGIGAALLGLNLLMGGKLNIALPLVFLMLGGIFYILVYASREQWPASPILYIPGSLLLTFGLIFLIDVLTNDWNSWAYAWLLLLVAAGAGLLLTNNALKWHAAINQIGISLTVGGLALFALFGAIAGGVFIQVMAPILLILGGAWLYWQRPEAILPDHLLKRLHMAPRSLPGAAASEALPASQASADAQPQAVEIRQVEPLVEALSARELEVLRMVADGLSNQQIALKMNIAPSTVKTHINNLYGKLGIQTRVQAIKRAHDLGIL